MKKKNGLLLIFIIFFLLVGTILAWDQKDEVRAQGLSIIPYWHPNYDLNLPNSSFSTFDFCDKQGIVGCWKLDGDGVDSSPFAINGTVSGVVEDTTNARVGTSMIFNDSTDKITIPRNNSYRPIFTRTTSFWYYPNATSSAIIYEEGTNFWSMYQCTTNKFGFIIIAADGYNSGGYNVELGINDWHHIVLSYNNVTGSDLWIDNINRTSNITGIGGCIALNTNSGNINRSGSSTIIGFRNALDFTGNIDNLMIFNRSLSAAEIAEINKFQSKNVPEKEGYRAFVNIKNTDAVNYSDTDVRVYFNFSKYIEQKSINTTLYSLDPNSIRIYEVNQWGECLNKTGGTSKGNCPQINYTVDA